MKKLDTRLTIVIACCAVVTVAFIIISFLQSEGLFPIHQEPKTSLTTSIINQTSNSSVTEPCPSLALQLQNNGHVIVENSNFTGPCSGINATGNKDLTLNHNIHNP